MTKTNHELAVDAFSTSRSVIRAMIGEKSAEGQTLISAAAGKNTLFEDLGAFIDVYRTAEPYDLDDSLRDTLIGNTRRDVATLHTLCEFLLTELHAVKRSQNLIILITGIILLTNALILISVLV
jgi:hypothetical protein